MSSSFGGLQIYPGTTSYMSGSAIIYDDWREKGFCRYCGQAMTNKPGIYFSKDLCENCDKKLANEFWKTKIPKTQEYCQTCYSHIKACKCPKKKALDNLKQ